MQPARNTIQGTLVLDAVQKLHNHATADEIYERIATSHPNIGRGTVYRNLNKLAETGKIRKVMIPDGPDRFDHLCHAHYHVRCIECGKVFDVDMDYLPDLERKIKDRHGFSFLRYNLVFDGVCPKCSAAGSAEINTAHTGANSSPVKIDTKGE